MSTFIGRYAPTPSGSLHLGNLRTALAAWCQARQANGKFYLRFDDLDQLRVKPEKIEEHQRDLKLLGINWDGDIILESQRIPEYQLAIEKLKESRRAYPCFCSRKEIKEYWAEKKGTEELKYPGICREINPADAEHKILNGQKHCWRFRTENDLNTHSKIENTIQDFVIVRADGVMGYQLACAVDDCTPKMTHILRGVDLSESTTYQKLIQQALALQSPKYFHVGMLTGEKGRKLSKRDGDDDLSCFLDQGYSADGIRNYLAWTLGQIEKGETPSLLELAQSFSFEKIPKGNFELQTEDLNCWK